MNITTLLNDLMPGDVVTAKHRELALFTHYIVYLGIDNQGSHRFIANLMNDRVRILSPEKLQTLFQKYRPTGIRMVREGVDRSIVVNRALSLLGKPYDLLNFNCEHFANFVQLGDSKSIQVTKSLITMSVVGLGLILFGRK